mgnify:FL=1|jgi:predicted extracellular nuclease
MNCIESEIQLKVINNISRLKPNLLIPLLFSSFFAWCQTPLPLNWDEPRDDKTLRIAFYNVENIFDTIDHPIKRDEEFTPNADRQWNGYKYWDKLNKTSKAIASLGGWQLPDIVGVCEIENDTVLNDLIKKEALKNGHFEIAHFNAPDARGIDVGLLYNSSKLTFIHSEPLLVSIKQEPNFKTRDILYVKLLFKEDTLHFFVNHWPSRRGGSAQSEYKRIRAAEVLKSKVDSISQVNSKAHIIVMGDFNDTPKNTSISEVLLKNDKSSLINLMDDLPKSFGTHKYQGHWSYIDQIIISKELESNLTMQNAVVFWQEWMLEKDSKHPGYYPKRSWRGIYYNYGFSDHLPVFIDLKLP